MLLELEFSVADPELAAVVSLAPGSPAEGLPLPRVPFISVPLCREAAEPEAVLLSAGVDDMSLVSWRAHPANEMRVAAINANFFIISFVSGGQ